MTRNEDPDGQVDLGDRQAANDLKNAGQKLPQRNPNDDTEKHPDRQVALEDTHRRGVIGRRFADRIETVPP